METVEIRVTWALSKLKRKIEKIIPGKIYYICGKKVLT